MTVCRVGLISDTHGLLRPQALAALRGSDHIVHAGDIGDAAILEALAQIAPVSAVRGNNDHGEWAAAIPHTLRLALDGVIFYVIHDLGQLVRFPPPDDCRVVVSGHSHRPLVQSRGERLFINPGSAGPRRFRLPVSVGRVTLTDGSIEPALIELSV